MLDLHTPNPHRGKERKMKASVKQAKARLAKSKSLRPHERAERLFKEAEKLGMDAPTEAMVAEAIFDHEGDTIWNYEIAAAHHDDSGILVKDLLRREKNKAKKDGKWQRYLDELDSVE